MDRTQLIEEPTIERNIVLNIHSLAPYPTHSTFGIPNQNPEQKARDIIDQQLLSCGWIIQAKNKINLAAALGIAVREYQTDASSADYVLFIDKKPVGVTEAKREEEGYHLTTVEEQSGEQASAKKNLF